MKVVEKYIPLMDFIADNTFRIENFTRNLNLNGVSEKTEFIRTDSCIFRNTTRSISNNLRASNWWRKS
jgi:hypothetical protein